MVHPGYRLMVLRLQSAGIRFTCSAINVCRGFGVGKSQVSVKALNYCSLMRLQWAAQFSSALPINASTLEYLLLRSSTKLISIGGRLVEASCHVRSHATYYCRADVLQQCRAFSLAFSPSKSNGLKTCTTYRRIP